jgi:hypothetical protein
LVRHLDVSKDEKRELNVPLDEINNVPAVYGISVFARDGGLLSYGNDLTDTFRRAASYVDRSRYSPRSPPL